MLRWGLLSRSWGRGGLSARGPAACPVLARHSLVGRRLRRGLVCCSWRGGGCGPAGSARRRGPAWPETVNRVCGPRKALRPTDRIRAKICAHTQIYARVRSPILALSPADTARSKSPTGHRPLPSGAADAACCADLAPGSGLDCVRSRSGHLVIKIDSELTLMWVYCCEEM